MNMFHRSGYRHQRVTMANAGFTMVEVMVALLIFTISLLGLAGLQAASLRDNQSALLNSTAAQLISSMGERIRANPEGASAGGYLVDSSSGASPEPPPANCYTGQCSPAQIAASDAYEWLSAVSSRLPSASGKVTSNGDVYTVSVTWRSESGGGGGNGCNAPQGFTCLQIQVRL
ncbi:MAG TPA: type IV pilus modification protein PilV [Gammaproteobacteria bacterium]|nr:type IV pilus modification protein PilV [Gammaproteobacteria bacterium]